LGIDKALEQGIHIEEDRQHVLPAAADIRAIIQEDQSSKLQCPAIAFRVPGKREPLEVLIRDGNLPDILEKMVEP